MTKINPNSDGLLSAKPPKPSLAIGREKVFLAIGLVGVLLAIGVVTGNKSNAIKPSIETAKKTGSPSYNIASLPSSYAELPASPTPQPPPPSLSTSGSERARLEPRKPLSSQGPLNQKLQDEKAQRAYAAKLASVSFQNLQIPPTGSVTQPSTSGSEASSLEQLPSGSSSRDDDNRQDDKNEFISSRRTSPVALNQKLLPPLSRYQLMAGSVIPGLLLTALNSDLPGQILGQVSQNVFDTVSGNHLLLPQGTKVIGEYDSRIVYGQERVLIVWTRLILPNGKSISLEGMPGVDLSGSAGLSDRVNNHWGKLISGVVFSSLLGAGAQIAQGRTYNSFDPSFGELATQGFAQNMNQVGQQITRKNLNIQPTIEIRPGYRFNIFVNRDIGLEPYIGRT
jgi:type IV secretion system protein VirB10